MSGQSENDQPPAGAFTTEAIPVVAGYELLEKLASDGKGIACKAHQLSSDRLVVLELAPPGWNASASELRRFHKEAEAAAKLAHPNIVAIHEAGVYQGRPYLSRALVEGSPLADHLPRLAQDPRAAAGLLAQIAWAVQYAHERGVVHGHLEPGAVLIDAHAQPHIIGFGRASWPGEKPGCSAPEKSRGTRSSGPAADVYGLGVILYECLTGRPPCHGESLSAESLDPLARVPRPHGLNPKVDDCLEAICLRCLETAPRRRYRTAAALAEDLERWLAGKPVTASHAPPPHQRLVNIGGSLAATVLAILGGYYWFSSPGTEFPLDDQVTVEMVKEHIHKKEFEEALHDLEKASFDDKTKEKLRAEAITDWLSQVPKPNPENVDRILADLEHLLDLGKENPEVMRRLTEARAVRLPVEVGRLVAEREFEKAYDLLAKPEIPGKQRDELRERLWTAWADDAEQKWRKKDYRAALAAAEAILKRDSGEAKAKQIKDEVQTKIAAIQGEVKKRLVAKQFADAFDYAKQTWPLNSDLHDKIIAEGQTWAKKLLDEKKYEEAKRVAAELLTKKDDDKSAKTIIKKAGQGLNRVQVEKWIASGAAEDYKGLQLAAASLKDQKKDFDEHDRKNLFEKLEQAWLDAARNELDANKKKLAFDVLVAKLDTDRVRKARKDFLNGMATEVEVADAFRLTSLEPRALADRKTRLMNLKGRATGKLLGQVEKLLTLLQLAEESSRQPTGDALDRFFDLAKDAKVSKAGRENLDATYALLLDHHVEKLIATVPDNQRWAKARRVLAAGARNFRDSTSLQQPFGTADNADAVLTWLQRAERLSSGKLELKDQTNLALAAWYKSGARDPAVGRLALGALKQEQDPRDILLLRFIHARSCGGDLAGRKESLDSYLAALTPARGLLKGKQGDKVAEYLFTNLLAPALDKQGEFLGTTAKGEVSDRFARLCAGLARLLKENVTTWSNLKGQGGKELLLKSGPLKTAVQLYEQAARLASQKTEKAVYLTYQGFLYNQLPDSDIKKLRQLAEEAMRVAPEYAGAIGLRGLALVREAREKVDYADKLTLLEKADNDLSDALRGCATLSPEQRQELEPLLNRGKAGACLELANYVQDPKKQKDYLDQGTASIKKVLDNDKQNLEAWETYGLLLEDHGWLLGQTDKYKLACDALEKARDFPSKIGGKTGPWLASGRIRVKWAAAVSKRDAKSAQVDELLAAADLDLGEVTKYSDKTVAAAEAYYWIGKVHALKDFRSAAEAFKVGAQLAQDLKSQVWEDLCLTGWTELAYVRALDRYQRKAGDAEDAIQYAQERAKDLERFSKARATLYEVALLRCRYFLKDEYPPPSDVLKLLDGDWLKKGRLQDAGWRAFLLVDRAETRFFSLPKPEGDPDALQQVYDDARRALDLAKQGVLYPTTEGQAHGFAGLARMYASQAKGVTKELKQQYIQKAIPELRQAILLAPKERSAWLWKVWLAVLRTEKEATEAQEADRLEEVSRNLEEAERDLPKDSETQKSYSWIPRYRADTDKVALPALRRAVTNEPQAETAWRWHWRIAELLRDDNKEEALTNARQALKKIPKDVPAHQRQRIEELLKKLE